MLPNTNQIVQDPAKEKENKRTKMMFTQLEDKQLVELVQALGQNSWKYIAELIPGRTSRQCRERYKYFLNPMIKRNEKFSEEEDRIILEKMNIFGTHWSKIATFLNGRSDVNVKNRYNQLMRSRTRDQSLYNSIYDSERNNATIKNSTMSNLKKEFKKRRDMIEFPLPISMMMLIDY